MIQTFRVLTIYQTHSFPDTIIDMLRYNGSKGTKLSMRETASTYLDHTRTITKLFDAL